MIPSYLGYELSKAIEELEELGIKVKVETTRSLRGVEGEDSTRVIKQSVQDGVVTLLISGFKTSI